MLSEAERKALEEFLKIDLNSATADEIQNIPRIGPKMAEAIVAYREANGPFQSFDDLLKISRFGPSLRAGIAKYAKLSGVDEAAAVARPVSSKIDLNEATQEQLETLPGVGPSMAEKIIAGRPFRSIEGLLDVPGIGQAKFDNWKDLVSVGRIPAGAARPAATAAASGGGLVNINTATVEQLVAAKIPGVGPAMAQKIVAGRPYTSVDDLLNVSGIGPAKFASIKPRVTVQ
jgi:competence protein ComEA